MHRLLYSWIWISAAAATFVVVPARAEDHSSQSSYERAIDEGISEFDLGNFQEAREQFRLAHETMPNARTLRALGMVEFELRNYGASAEYLKQSLASVVKPLGARLRAEVEQLLNRARGYLGDVHIAMNPAAARVLVDGAEVELGPGEILTLQVGDHVLEFRAQGHLPARRTVQIKGGQKETVRVTLTPALSATSSYAAERDDRPLKKKWWPWALVGSVIAGGVAATAVLLLRRNSRTEEVPLTTPSGVAFQALRARP